jgi:hypothetical protein
MIAALLWLALPWAVVAVGLRRLSAGTMPWAMAVSVGAGLSLGLASLWWWLLLQLPLHHRAALVALDLVVWIAILAWAIGRGRASVAMPPDRASATPRSVELLVIGACVVTTAVLAVWFVASTIIQTHGVWDAWAIWNARARFLARGWPDVWPEAFARRPTVPHADYPLLLPLSVARVWIAGGVEGVAAPIAVAAIFAGGVLSVVVTSIARVHGRIQGLIAVVFLTASATLVTQSSAQIADVPLAFFLVAAVAVADETIERRAASGVLWAVAGALACLAGWTKNEGLVFAGTFGAIVAAWLLVRRRDWRAVLWLAAGAAPVVAAIALFRLRYAPPSEYAGAITGAQVLAHLHDAPRLRQILTAIGAELWSSGTGAIGPLPILVVCVALAGLARPMSRAAVIALAAALVMLAADIVVYDNTPYDLAWQLQTSANRVVMQLFPLLIWAGLRLARPIGGSR